MSRDVTERVPPGTETRGSAILRQLGAGRRSRAADLEPLLTHLVELGWTPERLATNDLYAPGRAAAYREELRRFWLTMHRLARELRDLGLPPIFIKCVREYPYRDSNVDVLVPRRRLRSVEDHLCERGWARPRPWDTFEQLLIERAKRKLPSTDPEVLTAHLYGGVSWRYQGDLGLLRRDGREPDTDQLEEVALGQIAGGGADDGAWTETRVWLPGDPVELVLQAAHITFENFRITLGEAIHLQLLKQRTPESLETAFEIADRIGCRRALELIDRQSEGICSRLEELDPADFPRTLPLSELAPAFRERAGWLLRQGRAVSATNELGTAVGVYLLVSSIRRRRRRRRGHEGYR